MLLSLYVKNFGLIEQLEVDWQSGLNVITGETGAGKSLVVEALQLALGGRAMGEQIRTGTDKAVIQATFALNQEHRVFSLLETQGIAAPEDGILILQREINQSGRNICRLNGQAVTLLFYRTVGKQLVDTHIQHEQHSLLDQARQSHLLDRFGGAPVYEALHEVKSLYARWQDTRSAYEALRRNEKERNARADALQFEIKEIEQADLKPGEDHALSVEKKILVNAEKICLLAGESYSLLYEGSYGQAATSDLLSRALELLRHLAHLDESAAGLYQTLENVLYQVEDTARELAAYQDRVENNPQRLALVEERLALINNLKNKYGKDISDILAYLAQARTELAQLADKKESAAATAGELNKLAQAYRQAAGTLSARRRQAAKKLEERAARELADLEMGRIKFQVAFHPVDEPSPSGGEKAEFLISTNPGEPLKPLAKIASGGELSRVMLALKALLANADDIPVIIFDEVDTGIGGRALHAVAEKLAGIGAHHQVICVTHAPQIAGYASAHYRVSKDFDGERTVTRVEKLERLGRVEELARMLGGKAVTDITRSHARQMLKSAAENVFENVSNEGIS